MPKGQHSFFIQELPWSDVKNEVKLVNPELFKVIENVPLNQQHTLIKVRYPFGAMILENGIVNLPDEKGQMIPINSTFSNEKWKKKLSYSSVPLTLFLNRTCEVFIPLFGRIIPLNLIEPGSITFGLFETTGLLSGLTTNPPWYVTSGARSIFMLPKISEQSGYKRLKKTFNIPSIPPTSLADHWKIFVGISNHPKYIDQWSCDVLYFTNTWFDNYSQNKTLMPFYNYIFQQFRKRVSYLLSETEAQLTWANFSIALGKRNLKPRPYLIDTLKHLITLANGGLPGFILGDQSQRTAPTDIIQNELEQTYGLKKYVPTIITPYKQTSSAEKQAIYYSLSFPTLMEAVPDYKTPQPIIDDLREIKLMIETLYDAVERRLLQSDQVKAVVDNMIFEYFHSGGDTYGEILDTTEIPLRDPILSEAYKKRKEQTFCSTGPFLSAVIKIIRK